MGERPLRSEIAGVEIRRGLSVALLCWVLVAVASACTQLLATHATSAARADPRVAQSVLAVSSLATLVYRLFYSLMTAFVAAGALRIARASAATVRKLFLVAAAALALAAATNLIALGVGDSGLLLSSYWVMRAVGVATLLFGSYQLARLRGMRIGAVAVALGVTLYFADLLVPVLELSGTDWGRAYPWAARVLTLLPQLGVTTVFAWLCLALFRLLPQPEGGEQEEGTSPTGKHRATAAPAMASEPPGNEDAEPASAEDEAAAQPSEASAALQEEQDGDRLAASAQVGVVLLSLCGSALLPIWDVFGDERVVEGLASQLYGHGARGEGTSLLVLLIPAIALVLARGLFLAIPAQPYRARGIFAVMAILGAAYALQAAHGLALSRSHQASTWPNCEASARVSDAPPDGIAVARNSDGSPCLHLAERPGVMHSGKHAVSLRDGIVNIAVRFPGDRLRFFGGTLGALAALGWAGWLVFRLEE